MAALYVESFFTIFGPIELIRNSKSAGAMRVQFLYCPLIFWNFKSTNRLTPYMQFFFYTTVFATNVFLFVLFSWTKCGMNIKAVLATCKDMFWHTNIWWITNVQPVRLNIHPMIHTWTP
jgi:hypothetical protein